MAFAGIVPRGLGGTYSGGHRVPPARGWAQALVKTGRPVAAGILDETDIGSGSIAGATVSGLQVGAAMQEELGHDGAADHHTTMQGGWLLCDRVALMHNRSALAGGRLRPAEFFEKQDCGPDATLRGCCLFGPIYAGSDLAARIQAQAGNSSQEGQGFDERIPVSQEGRGARRVS